MLNRRSFLSSSFASSLAVGAGLAWRGNLWAQLESLPSKLPDRSLYDQNEDAYWRELRKQFLIPAGRDLPQQRHRGIQPGARAARRV